MVKLNSTPQLTHFNRHVLGFVIGMAIALGSWAVMPHSLAQTSSEPAVPSEPAETVPAVPLTPSIETVGNPLQSWTSPTIDAVFESQTQDADIAGIHLDGRQLFEVAAPSNDENTYNALERSIAIETELKQIAADFFEFGSPETLSVYDEVDAESNQPVIYVNDEMLMTVTYLDARINGSNSLVLRARQIVDDVEAALLRYYDERQPDFLWQQARWALATLLITLLASFALSHFAQKASSRRNLLREHQQEATPNPLQGNQQDSLSRMRTALRTKQQINSLGILKQALQILQVCLWSGSTFFVLGFFPYTRWLQPFMIEMLRLPVRFGIVALIAYGCIRLASLWIDRLFLAFQGRTVAHLERSQRLILRLSTFSQVIKGLIAFLIIGIAVTVMLNLLGVRVGPLIAGAGLVGFAVSFASQSLIKDIINGFLVLLEDQYGVGDVITVRGMSGFVETMNLRITQLRATDGQLITIPNGQIDMVQNASKEWSRVDLMIPVGLTADINQALSLVEQEADRMRQDDIWGPLILEPPLLLGIDELSHAGATIRIWIKTQPLKQWDVAREYRRRLKLTFEAAQIPLGVPQQVVQISDPAAHQGMLTAGSPFNGTTRTDAAPSSTASEP
ncbi:MAG: mechanosensitive ion channel family protein [Leptolyngbyaceae cyanobacterium]